jgi:hypothetical protein
MPAQTTVEKYIFPDGIALEISTDDGASFTDMGTLQAGSVFTYNYDKQELESGNNGKVFSRAKNETVALAPTECWTMDPEVMEKFSGSAFNYTSIAGTPVAGATQLKASGSWSYKEFILIENQNGDGSALTVNSVVGSVDPVLVENTDYIVGTNEKGLYGITPIAGGALSTEVQSLTIDYDYTPSAGKKITAGTSSIILERFIARMRHYTDTAKTQYDIECKVYGCDMDSDFSINFKGANEDGLTGYTVSFTGNVDTNKTDGAQLFELIIDEDATTSN